MRQIIEGKVYDTNKAAKLCEIECTAYRGDFRYHDTALYVTKNGAYFLAGHGNALSMWAESCAGGTCGGQGIRVLTLEEAKEYGQNDMSVDDYIEHFGVEEA